MPVANGMKVLLVDDQGTMRALMRQALTQLGFRDVSEAKSGQEALELLKIKRFDLIISDWIMEGIDGLQLLKLVRGAKDPGLARTVFIMATGQNDREQVRIAAEAKVNNYIIKPFSPADLKKKIEQVMGALT